MINEDVTQQYILMEALQKGGIPITALIPTPAISM